MSKPPPTPMDTGHPDAVAKSAEDSDVAVSAKVADVDVAVAPPDVAQHVHAALPDDLVDALETGDGKGSAT